MKVAVVVCYFEAGRYDHDVADVCVFTCDRALDEFLKDNIYENVDVYLTDTIGLGEKA